MEVKTDMKLPEPTAIVTRWTTNSVSVDIPPPLLASLQDGERLYTADQMQEAIIEERERCAAILENTLPTDERSVNWSQEDRVLDDVLRNLLADIRSGAE